MVFPYFKRFLGTNVSMMMFRTPPNPRAKGRHYSAVRAAWNFEELDGSFFFGNPQKPEDLDQGYVFLFNILHL